MSNLIGLGMAILGGVTMTIFPNSVSAIVSFFGILLFASFRDEGVFCDYIIANSNMALVRKRHYLLCIPLFLFSFLLTLGKAQLKIVWKEEYYKISVDPEEDDQPIKIPFKEYNALRNEQRKIYSTQTLSREFMEKSYSVEGIGFKRKKRRLIIAAIFLVLMLTVVFEPGGIYISLIYEAIFVPMVILWIPDYKDAKILQQAYERALNSNPQTIE